MRLSELRGFRHMASVDFWGKPLTFNASNHRYKWGDEYVPNVSTIVGQLAKPGLVDWAARIAVDDMLQQIRAAAGKEVEVERIAASAKLAHRAAKDKASDDGASLHDYALKRLAGEPLPPLTTDAAKNAAAAFEKWAAAHKVEPLPGGLERRILSKAHMYAGTCDFYGYIDGRLAVADFKSGGHAIYKECWLQVAGYAMAIEEELSLPPSTQHVAVHLSKETGQFGYESRSSNMRRYGAARLGFLALLNAYGHIKSLERKED